MPKPRPSDAAALEGLHGELQRATEAVEGVEAQLKEAEAKAAAAVEQVGALSGF